MTTTQVTSISPVCQHSDEQAVVDRYRNHVQPFWNQKVAQGVFTGVSAIEIRYAYAIHPKPLGSIAISSGRIESLIKYKELVYNLYHSGYSVFIHDHRGQGFSGRMTDNPDQGYVDSFDDYVTDFKAFYDKVIAPKSEHKPKLLCHSMGGAIGTLYVLKHPNDFSHLALSAPMFGIRPALPKGLAKFLVCTHLAINKTFSDQPWYFLGQGDYAAEPFSKNVLSSSEARYKLFRNEYEQHPEVKLGGVTSYWLEAAIEAMDSIAQRASEIKVPVLLLQAGDDEVVDNRQQDIVAAKIPQANILTLEGAKHELLMEQDGLRTAAMRAIHQFFSENP